VGPTFARLRSRCSAYYELPGIPHLQGVRALETAGFKVVREGNTSSCRTDGAILTNPRHNPVNAITMGGIVVDAGLRIEEFRRLF
jgi:hypothetical protein